VDSGSGLRGGVRKRMAGELKSRVITWLNEGIMENSAASLSGPRGRPARTLLRKQRTSSCTARLKLHGVEGQFVNQTESSSMMGRRAVVVSLLFAYISHP